MPIDPKHIYELIDGLEGDLDALLGSLTHDLSKGRKWCYIPTLHTIIRHLVRETTCLAGMIQEREQDFS